jgi:hypothetical protein
MLVVANCLSRDGLAARDIMSDNQFPDDAIFVKWGRFQAGVFGRLAIVAIIVLAIVIGASRAAGLF